jgi:hypothetical protein
MLVEVRMMLAIPVSSRHFYVRRANRLVFLCTLVVFCLVFIPSLAFASEVATNTSIQTDKKNELSSTESTNISVESSLGTDALLSTVQVSNISAADITVQTVDPSSGLTYTINTGSYGYGAYVTGFASSTVKVPATLGGASVVSVDFEGDTPVSLDVSGCTALRYLYCESNHAVDHMRIADGNLVTLNASGCTSLESIHCAYNRLRSIDLTGCTSLELLFCNDNRLTSLDISAGYHTMFDLYCSHNYLRDTSNLRSEMSYLSHQWLIEFQYNSDISQAVISAIDAQPYTGSAITPAVTVTLNNTSLVEGVDYALTYAHNVSSGTASVIVTGLDVYTGSQTVTFQILPVLPATGDSAALSLVLASALTVCGAFVLVAGSCLVRRSSRKTAGAADTGA